MLFLSLCPLPDVTSVKAPLIQRAMHCHACSTAQPHIALTLPPSCHPLLGVLSFRAPSAKHGNRTLLLQPSQGLLSQHRSSLTGLHMCSALQEKALTTFGDPLQPPIAYSPQIAMNSAQIAMSSTQIAMNSAQIAMMLPTWADLYSRAHSCCTSYKGSLIQQEAFKPVHSTGWSCLYVFATIRICWLHVLNLVSVISQLRMFDSQVHH